MIFLVLSLLFLLNGNKATLGQQDHGGMKAKHTLYFLSILPYPDPEPSLSPSIADGPDLFPAVQLAVDHVNNRSDVLRDYHIELIETDGGCDISSKALISLVSQLFHSDKQIAGIIGPSCSESAKAVGALSRRSEIALLSFHQGSSPLLADRTYYPYSIGMAVSPTDEVTAYIDLMKQAKWTRIAAIYSLDYYVRYFQQEAKAAGIEIVFSEIASETFIPYKGLKESYARVIIAFVRAELATNIMCVAYHKDLIYPNYQWILNNGYYYGSVSFYYEPEDREYRCTAREMRDALDSEVSVILKLPSAPINTEIISGMSIETIIEAYYQRWELYNNSTDLPHTYFAFLAYDSVWAMALALNDSLETLQEKNMSLTNYTYGQSSATEVILEHLYQLEFHGVSGLISFNEQTGFTYREPLYYHSPLVKNSFEAVTLKIVIGLAVVVILIVAVTTVLVAFVHILNTVYENYKSIKASSSRLNHFAYVGCYCVLLALLAYTIVEAFSTSPLATTVLCNFIPWLTSIGFSLVFGTAIVKTWRIRKIFFELELQRGPRILKDHFLSVFVLSLTALDIVVCALWSSVDPLRLQNETAIVPEAKFVIVQVCTSNYMWVWSMLLLGYKLVLQVVGMLLSLWTNNIEDKNFKTRSIKYFLPLSFVLILAASVPISLVSAHTDIYNVNFHYTTVCVVVTSLVYLCWGLLLLPPVLPLLREKVLKCKKKPSS